MGFRPGRLERQPLRAGHASWWTAGGGCGRGSRLGPIDCVCSRCWISGLMRLPLTEREAARIRGVWRDCTAGRRRDERRAVLAYRRLVRCLARPIEGDRAIPA